MVKGRVRVLTNTPPPPPLLGSLRDIRRKASRGSVYTRVRRSDGHPGSSGEQGGPQGERREGREQRSPGGSGDASLRPRVREEAGDAGPEGGEGRDGPEEPGAAEYGEGVRVRAGTGWAAAAEIWGVDNGSWHPGAWRAREEGGQSLSETNQRSQEQREEGGNKKRRG